MNYQDAVHPNRPYGGPTVDSESASPAVSRLGVDLEPCDPVPMARPTESRAEQGLYSAGRRGIWVGVVALTVRALLLAVAAVILGSLVDGVAAGEGTRSAISWLSGLLVAAAIVGAALPLVATRTSWSVETDVRERVLRTVVHEPTRRLRTGEVTTRSTEGTAAVASLAGTFLPQLIGGVLIPLLICGIVATIDLPTSLVLLVTVPAVPLLLRMMEKRFANVTTRYRATADQLTARFFDGVQGLATLRALDAADEYGVRLKADSERLRQETMRLLRINQLALLAVDSLFTLGTVVAAAGAAMWRLGEGAITGGEAVSLVLLGVALIEPMSQIGRFFYVGAIGRASARDIRSFLTERGLAFTPRRGEGARVVLDGVGFGYDEGAPVFDSVSFTIEPGEVVGLVGPSGGGKTTLAGLISGLLTPVSGSVEVSGRVAVVSQRPFLFHGTLRENLLLAKPDANDDEILTVIEAAELAHLVDSREDGLDLQVGERGLLLSGGEMQRLTIARMLLTGAPVVVLDEPTSNVDIETETRIRAALDRLTADKTVIVIAHRRSTLAGVDRLLAVGDGTVIETTTVAP